MYRLKIDMISMRSRFARTQLFNGKYRILGWIASRQEAGVILLPPWCRTRIAGSWWWWWLCCVGDVNGNDGFGVSGNGHEINALVILMVIMVLLTFVMFVVIAMVTFVIVLVIVMVTIMVLMTFGDNGFCVLGFVDGVRHTFPHLLYVQPYYKLALKATIKLYRSYLLQNTFPFPFLYMF